MNVRFIAATNQDLAEKVKRNEFRKDLFFRLNVMVIRVPPFRERTEDIPVLARHFMARYAKEFTKRVEDLHPSAVTELVAYPWPGNVRELRNVMERAVMLAKGDRIGIETSPACSQCPTNDSGMTRRRLPSPTLCQSERAGLRSLQPAIHFNQTDNSPRQRDTCRPRCRTSPLLLS